MICPICGSNIYGNSCLKCGYVKNNKVVDHQENDKNIEEYNQQIKKLHKYIAVIIFLIVTLVMAIIMLRSLNKAVEKKGRKYCDRRKNRKYGYSEILLWLLIKYFKKLF